eukprot:TRINITY_DN93618_c0_g1_i1.p1 TRINITY_DN93618_c0_g1~~TRINITY_DN93618_c0_g1_i1.p1  ORF type:complete len:465 (+),score=121.63 TRINITY_DN93618_c0_g1_i1:100-1494(+)
MYARVKNTFLEFSSTSILRDKDEEDDLDEEDDDDSTFGPSNGLRRQLTDSIVERSKERKIWQQQKEAEDDELSNKSGEMSPMGSTEYHTRSEEFSDFKTTNEHSRQASDEPHGNSCSSSTKEDSDLLEGKAAESEDKESSRVASEDFSRSSTVGFDEMVADSAEASDKGQKSKEQEEFHRDRQLALDGGGLNGKTTVMMQHVPTRYTQRKLMSEINLNFLGYYDFFYLPSDPRTHMNRGFAFINLTSPEIAELFYQTFHRKTLNHFSSSVEEPITVVPASIQGFVANAERFISLKAARRSTRKGHPLFLRPLPSHLAEDNDEEDDSTVVRNQQQRHCSSDQELRNVKALESLHREHEELTKMQNMLLNSMDACISSQGTASPSAATSMMGYAVCGKSNTAAAVPVVPGLMPGQLNGLAASQAPPTAFFRGNEKRPMLFCPSCGSRRGGMDYVYCPFCGACLAQD